MIKTVSKNTKNLIAAGIFATLICVGAFIKIPLLFVPVTLQVFFVNFSALYQERRYAALSVMAYILLGLIGLPIFAGGGGFGYVLNPTFGYIIGFLLATLTTGYLKGPFAPSLKTHFIFTAINILIIHICGVFYFYMLSNFYLGNQISLPRIIYLGSLIFIPGDVLSGILSSFLAMKLRKFR
jgi:biotin transport system substrate-specific component